MNKHPVARFLGIGAGVALTALLAGLSFMLLTLKQGGAGRTPADAGHLAACRGQRLGKQAVRFTKVSPAIDPVPVCGMAADRYADEFERLPA